MPFDIYLRSLISKRISYFLKLKSPAFNTDTACSSSFNALDAAFKAIRSGQCDNALVGGSNLLIHPGSTLQFFRLGVLSQEGKCKVFDQSADGYVRGETIACILLQKAKNAKRIYAKIINTKVNGDGFKDQGITFPSTQAQINLMTEIYEDSKIQPSELSFLEAHGTGTQVGDPQEVEAIDFALAQKREKPLLVGSVKSCIGHTEPLSGLCSLIKVLLAMETGYITPNINLIRIKEGLKGFEEGRMKVVTENTELEGNEAVVGINNFGFGGNNGHAIIQRLKKRKLNNGNTDDNVPILVCVSGRSEAAVSEMLQNVNNKILDSEHVALLHHIFKINVPNHLFRGYTILTKCGPIATSSKFWNSQIAPLYILFGQIFESFELGSYFMKFPVFRNTVSRVNKILLKEKVKSFEQILKSHTAKDEMLGSICVQIGIVDIIKCLDLQSTVVYGDFCGKLVNAYYYNVTNLEETVALALKINNLIDADAYFENTLNDIKHSEHIDFLKGDSFCYEDLRTLPKNAIILNVSSSHLNNKDVLLMEGKDVRFLSILGRLYEQGHVPQLQKLYPKIEFPVSRGTPMIAPLIQWDHTKKWYTYKFSEFESFDCEQKEISIQLSYDEYKHISGHVIDGRNIFPAAEYLHLVWSSFAQNRRLLTKDLAVIFEDCKFNKAIMAPKSGFLKLLITIQRGTGNFEIFEKDSVVVSGRIRILEDTNSHWVDLKPKAWNDDPAEVLEQDEVYRELSLRGYNYSGHFKGIQKCNSEGSLGFLKWGNNWSTFMDAMLQMKILQTDTRLLYVPVGIKKLVVDPLKHFEIVNGLEGEEPFLPIQVYADSDLISSGGVQISGLKAKSIFKRKPKIEPVLEKNIFVPNFSQMDLAAAVRINVQIILENTLQTHFKAVEIIDELTDSASECLLKFVFDALDDVPVVTPELTISSKIPLQQIPGIKVEDMVLTTESSILLITGTKLLQRPHILKERLTFLHKDGFILTREDVTSVLEVSNDVEIVTEYTLSNEKLVMLKRSQETADTKFIPVYSGNLNWLPDLQFSLKNGRNVVVYSKDNDPEGILGLVNCIRREPNGKRLKCFYLVGDVPEFDPKISFYSDQIKKNLAINICENKIWGSYRHLRLEKSSEIECEHRYANVTSRGDISSLKWLEGSLNQETTPKNGILITTYYSAVNFRDIMAATGRVNLEVLTTVRKDQDCPIGIEFSGRDQSGRRVYGIVSNRAISSYIVGDEGFLWEVPDSWSLEEAATIPVVYSTVLYALLIVHRLKRGSSILIHSGTGGIGLAAINVCTCYDCDIYVTVGTEEKRKYLIEHYPQIPSTHIGNSRDISFEEMIKHETQGRGVDVVLNSLSEDKLQASIRCLARGGCFLEIGKFDLGNDTSLKLLLMEKQAKFCGIMLDKVQLSSDEIRKQVFNIMTDGIRTGLVKPLPKVVFKAEEIEKSYRYMMAGTHIGKVLVKLRDEEQEKLIVPPRRKFLANPRFNCDPRCSYIIIGGFGGVGMELCDWLIMRGATKVILVSRTDIRTGYQTKRLRIWRSYGVDVRTSTSNVTTYQGCVDLINEAIKLGPVDAVFNLGVVLKDGLVEDQTKETFLISFAPKAQATIHLDKITRRMCPLLRYFVVFSSVSCGRGNAGQSNYGMANSIMERICEKRKREGLPALAIQWGAIGEVGLVAKMQKENKELVIGGTLQQRISSCLEVLDTFLMQDNPVVASMVVAEKLNRSHDCNSVVETVTRILGIKNIKSVSHHVTLAELGMDSMMGTEIIQVLEKEFEIYLTVKDMRSLTIAKLTEIDNERSSQQNKSAVSKTELGVNLFLQNIPDGTNSHLKFIKLPSAVDVNEEARTVFIFPGVEGVLRPLESLSKQLKAHVQGVQYNYHNPEETIQQVANNVASDIEHQLCKNAEFFFIGYSFGANVSLNTALILEEKGYFGTVVAIDGSPTLLTAAVKEYFPVDKVEEFETALVYKLLSFVLSSELLMTHMEKLIQCRDFDERISIALTLIPVDASTKQKLERQAAVTLYKRLKAVVNYKSTNKKLNSVVHLFKAKHPMVKLEEEDYQLSQLCEKPVSVTVVRGDHATVVNQPELAENINKLLTFKEL